MSFTLDTYRSLLGRLADHYPAISPAVPPFPSQPVCLLRHDVDLVLTPAILGVAEVEEDLGIRSAWFIRPDGHYNPLSRESRQVLTRLAAAGHRIGLHYDCASASPLELERGFRVLRMALRPHLPADAITGHRPTLAQRDYFRTDKRNPGSIIGHGYVADSRRTPIALPDPLPRILQVNVHPEHYITDLPLAEHYAALADELAVSLPVAA